MKFVPDWFVTPKMLENLDTDKALGPCIYERLFRSVMAINNARSRNGGIGVCQKMRMNFKKDYGMMSIHAAW